MNKNGALIIRSGCMFSGKSTGFIAEIQMQLEFLKKEEITVYKPIIDDRYSELDIITHNGHSLKKLTGIDVTPIPVNYDFPKYNQCIAIDEIQFFDSKIFYHISKMIEHGVTVIVAGLDLDSDGDPFGVMPNLMALSNHIEKHTAICCVCGESATRTFWKGITPKTKIKVGGKDLYEPRCLSCWISGNKEKNSKID